jgi:hypothetical protein
MRRRGKLRPILLAVVIELIALAAYFPAFIEGMMRHSSQAPRGQLENVSGIVGFLLHLPTILLTYPFGPLVLITPFTQIVFWSWLLSYAARLPDRP